MWTGEEGFEGPAKEARSAPSPPRRGGYPSTVAGAPPSPSDHPTTTSQGAEAPSSSDRSRPASPLPGCLSWPPARGAVPLDRSWDQKREPWGRGRPQDISPLPAGLRNRKSKGPHTHLPPSSAHPRIDILFFWYLFYIYIYIYMYTHTSAYLRLLIFLPTILIPACALSSPAFLMMYSA